MYNWVFNKFSFFVKLRKQEKNKNFSIKIMNDFLHIIGWKYFDLVPKEWSSVKCYIFQSPWTVKIINIL